jgi:hypothetical protein
VALWELYHPRRDPSFPARHRRTGNIGFWLFNTTAAALVFRAPERLWIMPGWVGFIVGFVLLDLTSYWIHRGYHLPFFWRLHAPHHSDPDIDWSTSVRFHPAEYLLTAGIYWLALRVLGVPVTAVTSHVTLGFVLGVATHGNVRWPPWLERLLRPAIVTLNLHLVHHSSDPSHANANFGAVLSIWDRLFGTLLVVPQQQADALAFGVRELDPRDACRPIQMFLTPLRVPPMYTATQRLFDNQEIETSAERRGKRLRLRARLVCNGRVEAAHRADYAHDDAGAIVDFTGEFEELAHLENLRLFPDLNV